MDSAVYTIPAGAPFLEALARGLRARHPGREPLAAVRVLLPTRRACRALADAFLATDADGALLLPRIAPLGDLGSDEDDADLDGASALGEDLDLPVAIGTLERELLLTRLILGTAAAPRPSPDQAAELARALARLLDEVQIERRPFADLERLVPETYAAHWQKTLDFLTILTRHWPAVMTERGVVDPAVRRDLLLSRLAECWRREPPATPIVAAGSTGSVPATAELLTAIAHAPTGAVILPGLDRDMDEAAWSRLGPGHPQFGLKQLLERIGIDRAEVALWPETPAPAPARIALARAAMAEADDWDRTPSTPAEACRDLGYVECSEPEDEAGTIAMIMRWALAKDRGAETGIAAALVTRDRTLARRVAAELRRWDIAIDDSAGRPLDRTPPGTYLRLVAELGPERLAPAGLLAALKHPLAGAALARPSFLEQVRRLEIACLRGPRPAPDIVGLTDAASDDAELAALLGVLEDCLGPYLALCTNGQPVALADLVDAHLAAAEALARTDADAGDARLWRGDAGMAAHAFMTELIEAAAGFPAIAADSYPALIATLMGARTVREAHGAEPRLAIWGPLEARLQSARVMILGGLNEGSWPAEAEADPWLSRPMRARFGLSAPERRIGLAAHDFVQALCAPMVVLSRAAKTEGAPAVRTRWLDRLDIRLKADGFAGLPSSHWDWRAWYRALDAPATAPAACAPPAPRPPLAARPRRLSVTRIETWLRDPYAVYARYVLGLRPLDPIDADPNHAERGTIIHAALDAFGKRFPDALPTDAEAALAAIGRETFGATLTRPGVRTFWWPRFLRIAQWFIASERARRAVRTRVLGEVTGAVVLDAPGGPFTLSAAADRIEIDGNGALHIVDYKTGRPPTQKSVTEGIAVQLPLEGLIAHGGGFEGLAAAAVAGLAYWHLSGGAPAGREIAMGDPRTLMDEAAQGLARLIAAFDDAQTPYHPVPVPELRPAFNDYEHLARVKEWGHFVDPE